jgi:AcrR family transcriptional regulator
MNKKDKKKLIRDSSYEIFKKYGYDKTTMNEIAEETGLSKSALYYYYESKEDLFLDLILHGKILFQRELRTKIYNETDPIQRFKLFITEPFNILIDKAPMIWKILNEPISPLQTKICKLIEENHNDFHEIFRYVFYSVFEENLLNMRFDYNEAERVIFNLIFFSERKIKNPMDENTINELKSELKILADILVYGILRRNNE